MNISIRREPVFLSPSSYYNFYREKNVIRFALKICSNRRFDEMVGDRVMLSLGVQTTEEKENFEQISTDIQNNVWKEQWEFFQVEQNKYNVVAYSLMPQNYSVRR